MLMLENTTLLIVDVQGKLAHLMYEKEKLFENIQKIIKGIQVLKVPILWAEQNPKGLGPTVPEIASLLPDIRPVEKMSFSCCRDVLFMTELKDLNRKQVLIAGIETHICVYQTAVDLIDEGFEAQVLVDAVSSRTIENKENGLQKMRDAGVGLTNIETALFELLKVAEGPEFKEILKIIK